MNNNITKLVFIPLIILGTIYLLICIFLYYYQDKFIFSTQHLSKKTFNNKNVEEYRLNSNFN